MPRKLTMRESLEGAPFSTRLRSILMLEEVQKGGTNLDDIVRNYFKDPIAFRNTFRSLPGVGTKMFVELRDFILALGHPNDPTGRVTVLSFDEASDLRKAVIGARGLMAVGTPLYLHLDRLFEVLNSSVIHIEQVEDTRSIFKE